MGTLLCELYEYSYSYSYVRVCMYMYGMIRGVPHHPQRSVNLPGMEGDEPRVTSSHKASRISSRCASNGSAVCDSQNRSGWQAPLAGRRHTHTHICARGRGKRKGPTPPGSSLAEYSYYESCLTYDGLLTFDWFLSMHKTVGMQCGGWGTQVFSVL